VVTGAIALIRLAASASVIVTSLCGILIIGQNLPVHHLGGAVSANSISVQVRRLGAIAGGLRPPIYSFAALYRVQSFCGLSQPGELPE
jgi:hypothetical protein